MKHIVFVLILSIGQIVFSQTGDNLFLDNSKYLYAKTSTGINTRTVGINASNNLYVGSVDAAVNYMFVNLNGQNRLTINGTDGKIGVGTTTPPDGRLDIYGANANTTNVVLSANYEDSFRWRLKTIDRGYAIDLDITSSDSGDNEEAVLKLSRSNSTRPEFQLLNNAIVANNGNVGIGTASPTEKLHVAGDILGNRMLLNDPNTTNDWNTVWQSGFYQGFDATNAPEPGQWFWGVNLNHGSNHSTYRYNGQIVIKNSEAPAMYFRSTDKDGIGTWARVLHNQGNQFVNGALGIGTSVLGTYQLAVKGKIRAEEIKVETGWADYVFEEGYDLPPLEEVEKHIKEKGHLINIPSAQEVEKNGIELGEMNKLLLEKIEELTLYVIELKKENQEIKNLIIEKNEKF